MCSLGEGTGLVTRCDYSTWKCYNKSKIELNQSK